MIRRNHRKAMGNPQLAKKGLKWLDCCGIFQPSLRTLESSSLLRLFDTFSKKIHYDLYTITCIMYNILYNHINIYYLYNMFHDFLTSLQWYGCLGSLRSHLPQFQPRCSCKNRSSGPTTDLEWLRRWRPGWKSTLWWYMVIYGYVYIYILCMIMMMMTWSSYDDDMEMEMPCLLFRSCRIMQNHGESSTRITLIHEKFLNVSEADENGSEAAYDFRVQRHIEFILASGRI